MSPTPTGTRAVLYLRQSVSREDSISLELQENACRQYASQQGYTVVAVEADPGISGRTWKRPGVVRVMDMMESRQADVVVLWKWSRWSRSRLDWAVAADRVQTAGGRIESATEAIDVSTSTGRLARGMLTEFAAFESERIGDTWKETHARRIRNGVPANGKPRFGYEYTKLTGFTPHEIDGPILRETYLRYLAGSSFPALAKWLNDGPSKPATGYSKNPDGLWGVGTVKSMLDSGFGAGYITVQGQKHKGAHEALITEPEWAEYLTRRQQRAVQWPTGYAKYLLTGLIRCYCGAAMHGGQFGEKKIPGYRCSEALSKGKHKGGIIQGNIVEGAVMDWLEGISAQIDTKTGSKLSKTSTKTPSEATKSRLLKANRQDVTRLDTLTMKMLDGTVDSATYTRLKDTLEAAITDREAQLRALEVSERHPVSALVPQLLTQWPRLPLEVRRDLLSRLIREVTVHPAGTQPRAVVVPLWDNR